MDAGVMVTVRLAPLPPKMMLAFGTNVVLDELPETVKLPAAVSASSTVKAMAPVGVFSQVDWSEMSEIVGAVLHELVVPLATLLKSESSPVGLVLVAFTR